MSKRGENIWHRKDGRWSARYVKARINGKAVYGYLYGKTYGEVKTKRENLSLGQAMQPSRNTDTKQLSRVAEDYLFYRASFVKKSTLSRYREMLNNRILPYFQDVPISAISNEGAEQYIGYLRKSGLSEKSIRDTISLFYLILEYAGECGTPAALTKKPSLPKTPKKAVEIFTDTEQEVLECYLHEHISPETLGIYLALYTGLRIGELCALRWENINFLKGTLTVSATIQRISTTDKEKKTAVIIDSPKSSSSERTIPLPHFLINLLLPFRNKSSFYLLTGSENPTEPRSYYRKYKKILNDCHLPAHTFHALRHTFATRAIEKGFDSKTLSELLGHASVRLTLERYVHPPFELKRSYMEKMTPLLSELLSSG